LFFLVLKIKQKSSPKIDIFLGVSPLRDDSNSTKKFSSGILFSKNSAMTSIFYFSIEQSISSQKYFSYEIFLS